MRNEIIFIIIADGPTPEQVEETDSPFFKYRMKSFYGPSVRIRRIPARLMNHEYHSKSKRECINWSRIVETAKWVPKQPSDVRDDGQAFNLIEINIIKFVRLV